MGTRAELFAQEQKKAAEEKKKREEGKNFTNEYEDVKYFGLESEKVRVFRFIGNPYTIREKATDPKMVLSSWIIDDKSKPFVCKWEDNKNWFLWKVYNEVMKYVWDKDAPNPKDPSKPGAKKYVNAEKFPHLFKRVRWNGKDKPNELEKGWTPARSIVMNAISRDNYEWHKENKSFALVAKKIKITENESGEISEFPDPGIGTETYEKILKTVVEEKGAWEDFDIAIKKLKEKPWYDVYSFFDQRKIADDLECAMSGDPLTEEELSWKLIDIDKINQITSYRKIQNRLGDFIKEVDACLKTSFTAELEKLAAKEKEEWDAKKLEEATSEETVESKPEQKEEPKKEVRTRTRTTETSDFWQKMKDAGWVAVDKFKNELSDAVKDVVLNDDPEKVKFVIEMEGETLPDSEYIPCPDCHISGPVCVNFCPKCGAEFK